MEEAKAELKQLMAQKKKNYAKFVAHVFQPHISEQKSQELMAIREKIHHPVR
jgi:hypothetical protein